MTKDTFISVLQRNNPQEMMDYLLHNGKKPKPINPFRMLSKKEVEEFQNGTDNERVNGRD